MMGHLHKNIESIEKELNYTFQDKKLFIRAFTDPSFPLNYLPKEDRVNNESLVWLGNYLLQLVIADYIQMNHPNIEKGEANKKLSTMLNVKSCVYYMDKLNVFDYYLHQVQQTQRFIESEETDKPFKTTCFKSILSAIYLDGGKDLLKVSDFFMDHFLDELEVVEDSSVKNYKSLLNEFTQKNRFGMPLFTVAERTGADSCAYF